MDRTATVTLLQRAREGDTVALEELFGRSLPALRRWAAGRLPRWCRDGTDTHDLVQEAVIGTLARLDVIDSPGAGALDAYLRQAILNRIRDEIRRAGRRSSREPLRDNQVATEASPLEEAIGAQALARYEKALAQLDPVEREAIVGRIELGYSYTDLAAALKRPSAEAARLIVRRALLRLAKGMRDDT